MVETLLSRWRAFMDRQHQRPSGLVGRYVGERMVRQHAPETAWSTGLLHLAPADRVLEIGCGAGQSLALAAQQLAGGTVIGLDHSPTMLRSAFLRNRDSLLAGRMALVCGDLASLPIAAAAFDKMLTIHTFYFWDDPPAIISGLLRALRPGGRIVITLATGRRLTSGEMQYWPIHERVRMIGEQLTADGDVSATLHVGPDSRTYNNVALVLSKVGISQTGIS